MRRPAPRAQRCTSQTDDPNYIVINLTFENVDAASNFREFLINQIWSSPESAPRLAGVPTARVLTEVEL